MAFREVLTGQRLRVQSLSVFGVEPSESRLALNGDAAGQGELLRSRQQAGVYLCLVCLVEVGGRLAHAVWNGLQPAEPSELPLRKGCDEVPLATGAVGQQKVEQHDPFEPLRDEVPRKTFHGLVRARVVSRIGDGTVFSSRGGGETIRMHGVQSRKGPPSIRLPFSLVFRAFYNKKTERGNLSGLSWFSGQRALRATDPNALFATSADETQGLGAFQHHASERPLYPHPRLGLAEYVSVELDDAGAVQKIDAVTLVESGFLEKFDKSGFDSREEVHDASWLVEGVA